MGAWANQLPGYALELSSATTRGGKNDSWVRLQIDPVATEAVKKLLDQNITQVTEIRRLGRGQSIGSRCDRFNPPPPQVSEASSSNQPFNAVNGRGSSDTHRPWHSKLRRGRVEFIAPWTYRLPPSQPANFLSLCHILAQ